MTNSLRTKIAEKKQIGLKIHQKSKQYRIKQTLQKEKKSTYIRIKKYRNYLHYYSNQLEIHKNHGKY